MNTKTMNDEYYRNSRKIHLSKFSIQIIRPKNFSSLKVIDENFYG